MKAADAGGLPTSDLVLSAWTLRRAPFDVRVAAAADAGFGGITLRIVDYVKAREGGWTDESMLRLLEESGLRVVEVEFWHQWLPVDSQEALAEAELILRIASIFGARHVSAGLFVEAPQDTLAAGFAAICGRAAEYGLLVGLESLPYSAIQTPSVAWDVVRTAGEPNGGVILDTWHHHRAAASIAVLQEIPKERFVAIQINDAHAKPDADLKREARHARLMPGEGVIDLCGLLTALRTMGVDAPIEVDVPSDELTATLSPACIARRAVRSACEVLSQAGWKGARA